MAIAPPDPSSPKASPARLVFLVVAVTLLWGANWPAMKIAVTEIPPWTFRVISVFIAGAVLLALSRVMGQPTRFPAHRLKPLLFVSFVGCTGWHMLTAYGLTMIGGGRAAVIAFTMPVWATLLSVLFLGEQLTLRHGAALALGMIGMAILILPDAARLGAAPTGALLILAAAMVWAVQTVATKAYSWDVSTMALSGWQLVLGGIPILLVWSFLEAWPDLSHVTWKGVTAMVYVVFIALVFCFTAFLFLVRQLPAIVAALTTLAIPIVGLASSAMLLGEPIGTAEIAALGLVLVAMALVLIRPRPAA